MMTIRWGIGGEAPRSTHRRLDRNRAHGTAGDADVRRTQAAQIQIDLRDGPPTLAETTCLRCETLGVTIIAIGRNDNGAIQAAWCGYDCARIDGWPWLTSERSAAANASGSIPGALTQSSNGPTRPDGAVATSQEPT
jgi:hypothetical protein